MIELRKQPCHYCGGPGGSVDHKIPISKGGAATIENSIPACKPCNNFRGDRPYEEFKAFGWKQRPTA